MIRKRISIDDRATDIYYKLDRQFDRKIHFFVKDILRANLHDQLHGDIYKRIRNPLYGKISGM